MESQQIVLIIASVIGLIILFAQLKLFSINSHLEEIVLKIERIAEQTKAKVEEKKS